LKLNQSIQDRQRDGGGGRAGSENDLNKGKAASLIVPVPVSGGLRGGEANGLHLTKRLKREEKRKNGKGSRETNTPQLRSRREQGAKQIELELPVGDRGTDGRGQ